MFDKDIVEIGRSYGKVKFYNADKGFGFITDVDGYDLFFHISDCKCDAVYLTMGANVSYNLRESTHNNQRKKSAYNVVLKP